MKPLPNLLPLSFWHSVQLEKKRWKGVLRRRRYGAILGNTHNFLNGHFNAIHIFKADGKQFLTHKFFITVPIYCV